MAEAPCCPRCGYDLTGVVASWTQLCPLALTCSECGLSFELRLVLNEKLRGRTNFIEVTQSPTFRKFSDTARRALRPQVFWRWVVIEQRPNIPRMLLILPLMVLAGQFVCSVMIAALTVVPMAVDMFMRPSLASLRAPNYTDLCLFVLAPWFPGRLAPGLALPFLILAVLFQAMVPFTFLLLPDTLRQSHVRRVHLVRVGVWSWVALPVLLNVLPLFFVVGRTLYWISGLLSVNDIFRDCAVAAYGAWDEWSDAVIVLLFVGWSFTWWRQAIKHYLKLPTPWLITVSMTIIALLAASTVCLLVPATREYIAYRIWK